MEWSHHSFRICVHFSLLCDNHWLRRWRFTHSIYSPQVSHTHTGGLAQDKTKSFHPEKAVRQAPKGTASFTLYINQSIISSLLIEPVPEILCLVWHLVVDISISASRKTHLSCISVLYLDNKQSKYYWYESTSCGTFYNM